MFASMSSNQYIIGIITDPDLPYLGNIHTGYVSSGILRGK